MANFQSDGNFPGCSDLLKSSKIAGANDLVQHFKSIIGMPSAPVALSRTSETNGVAHAQVPKYESL